VRALAVTAHTSHVVDPAARGKEIAMAKSFPLELLPTSTCECCDSHEITCIVQDMREGLPVSGSRTWEAFGGPHFFCETHERSSLRYMEDGKVLA